MAMSASTTNGNNQYLSFYQAGHYTFLGYPGATYTYASALNGQAQMVGTYQSIDGNLHGYLYSIADGCTAIDYPGALGTEVLGINSNGEMLVAALNDTAMPAHFLYYNGGWAALSPPSFTWAGPYAVGLNDFADITGGGDDFDCCLGPTVWQGFFGQTQH